MTTINIYLHFNGNCLQAFEFYKSVFGGEFDTLSRFGDMPPQEGMPPIPNEEKEKVMHVSLPISTETLLMGSDTVEGFGPPYTAGNNFSISVSTDTAAQADALFNALLKGGQVTMPMANTFWGSYFGMLTDQFGIGWMVSTEAQKEA